MADKKHYRLSVSTRNTEVISKVNKGASSTELAQEYGVTWPTIRDSIRNKHYKVDSCPHNNSRYEDFLAKVRANDAAASAKATPEIPDSPVQVPEQPQSDDNNGSSQQPSTPIVPDNHKPCIYLVETGYLLHFRFDDLLAMDNGEAVFMIPRFCINELKKMSQKTENALVKHKANEILLKMYAEPVWKKRIIPFEPTEQGMIPKTADIQGYKSRSFGIAEAALELYLDSDCRIHVLTNAMEIQHLIVRLAKNENLSSEITVTRIYNK